MTAAAVPRANPPPLPHRGVGHFLRGVNRARGAGIGRQAQEIRGEAAHLSCDLFFDVSAHVTPEADQVGRDLSSRTCRMSRRTAPRTLTSDAARDVNQR